MKPTPVYNVLGVIGRPLLYGIFRLRTTGQKNVPDGGCVIASNHLSNLDPWPLGVPLWPRLFLRFMAKAELYWWPMRLFLDAVGAFRVRRGQADTEAIETAIRLCHEGNVVVMFPEGTRRRKGLRKTRQPRPRSGAARIALTARVPLVPAALKGTDRLSRLGPMRVAYGPPIELEDLRGLDIRRASQEATDRLMARIAELEATL
ncbi:MAG: lysophospholipid acyltransferase family protein [Gaiellaceae bacterium]